MSNIRGSAPILKSSWAAWSLSVLTGVALLLSLVWNPPPPAPYEGLTAVRKNVPDQIAGYRLVGDNPVSEPVKKALAAADLLSRTYYSQKTNQTADFTLIGGTDRTSLHDPRSCLIGAGWRIENDHVETIPGTTVAIRSCRVLNGDKKYEAMYLYVVDGKTIHEVTEIRSQMLFSALIGRKNTPVCFVRFMRPLTTDSAVNDRSHEQFMDFVRQMWQKTDIPKSQTTQNQRV
jgi:hypothetical protein